jgi:hypothetical protein
MMDKIDQHTGADDCQKMATAIEICGTKCDLERY